MRFPLSLSLLLAAVLASACKSSPASPAGGTGGGAAGGGATGGSGTGGAGGSGGGMVSYPAPHPPMPQVVNLKGPVLAAPNIVGITFQGDTLQPDIDTFVTQIVAAKPYWSGATSEYGVGPLSASPPQHLNETPAAMLADADVQAWLTTKINAGGGFPQPDANTMYVIFYPMATTVTMDGGSLCQEFQGYHGEYQITPGNYVLYAVVGRCMPMVMNLAEIDQVTAIASHEIIEVATDPYPLDMPAYVEPDADHLAFAFIAGGEIGDLCGAYPDSFYKPTGLTTLVQRVWSNAAAAASHDPCQPDGASPYFNSAPVLTDSIHVVGSPIGSFTTKGAKIPVGSSKTVELDLYSDAPTSGPWKVSVIDAGTFFGNPATLSFKLDKTQGQNGDKIQLTIKALAASSMGASPFWIENDLGGVSTVWIGLVGN